MTGQLELGACGATARHPSYGTRTCVLPAGHQPPPGRPPTSTDGWHESADHIRWTTHEALADRAATHAAHVATMPLVGRVRLGSGSDATRKAHHAACEAAVTARRAFEQARDELVTAALEHECTT